MVQKVLNIRILIAISISLSIGNLYSKDNKSEHIKVGRVKFSMEELESMAQMTSIEKKMLYDGYKINPYWNVIFPLPPFGGYYRIGKFGTGWAQYFAMMYGAGAVFVILRGAGYIKGNETFFFADQNGKTKAADSAVKIVVPLMMLDVFFKTKKYNKRLDDIINDPLYYKNNPKVKHAY